MHQIPYWKRLWGLFWAYICITSTVIGGGYAIIAASDDLFVRRKKWITENDMLDIIAVTQTVPGILACNSAICVGLKVAGFGGALAALIGSMIPSVVIIILIAFIMRDVIGPEALQHPRVQGAFCGVIACITAMVVVTAVRMWPKIMCGKFEYLLTILCFAAMTFFDVNPGWIVLAAIPAGIVYVHAKRRQLDK